MLPTFCTPKDTVIDKPTLLSQFHISNLDYNYNPNTITTSNSYSKKKQVNPNKHKFDPGKKPLTIMASIYPTSPINANRVLANRDTLKNTGIEFVVPRIQNSLLSAYIDGIHPTIGHTKFKLDSEWYHVAMTIDIVQSDYNMDTTPIELTDNFNKIANESESEVFKERIVKVYLNGKLDGVYKQSQNIRSLTTRKDCWIGTRDPKNPTHYFHGKIKDLKVFQGYCLTQQEICWILNFTYDHDS